jgi:IS30 family transposase
LGHPKAIVDRDKLVEMRWNGMAIRQIPDAVDKSPMTVQRPLKTRATRSAKTDTENTKSAETRSAAVVKSAYTRGMNKKTVLCCWLNHLPGTSGSKR